MPILPVHANHDDEQDRWHGLILALHSLRRDLEYLTPPAAKAVAVAALTVDEQRGVLTELRELIIALDRRAPHLDRAGERDIAFEAALLKARAEARILAIEHSLES